MRELTGESIKGKISLVFFDLDGVIIDSLPDIASALNAALEPRGYAGLSEPVVQTFVGKGARYLVESALKESAARGGKQAADIPEGEFESIYARYIDYYTKNSAVQTRLYPGVRDMLDAYSTRGIPLAIVSHKPLAVTKEALSRLEILSAFSCVVGPELVAAHKPDPAPLEYALREINAAREGAGLSLLSARNTMLMAGDTDTDIRAGRAFGAKTCAITGGYGDTQKLLAERPDYRAETAGELIELL
jgi:phosphoglycolate phosphatase